MANLTALGPSIITMPLSESRTAPEKFKGKYNKIKSFITHYELLLEQNNVHSDADKCEIITRYCSRTVTDFIQALQSYTNKNWKNLKEDLLKYYDADLDTKKYNPRDLDKLAKTFREKKMRSLSSWREYGRKFITVAGWLLKKKRITDNDYAIYYWKGIPKRLRERIENRIMVKEPGRNLAIPFTVDEINQAAEKLLQRDRFDANIYESDGSVDSDTDADSDGGDSTDSDEDELRRLRRRLKKKTKYSKRKLESDNEESSDEEVRPKARKTRDAKRVVTAEEPEIETLINKINTMSITDPGYAALVFKALKLDPGVLKDINPPQFATRPSNNAPRFPQEATPFQPQMPPHMMQNAYRSTPPQFQQLAETLFRMRTTGTSHHRLP